jgi:flagellar biosynthesis protein FliR
MPQPELSQTLLALAFAFIMVLCRCGAAVMLLPGLGEDDPPPVLRVGIAGGLAVLLVPIVGPHLPPPPDGFLRLAGMLSGELLAGAFLGWLARLIALALPGAGQIISLNTGLSSVLQPDPTLGAQSSGIGKLFGMAVPVLILGSGLYAMPLSALAGSYSVWPAGGLPAGGDMTEMAVRAVSANFSLALRLAGPFMLMGLVWQVGLGLLSRLVPQLQIYFAALPGQVLGGLLLLAVLSGGLANVWLRAVGDSFAALPGH